MTSQNDPKGGGARSLAELHALGIMKRMPASLSLGSTEPVSLPTVQAPSLEGLTVAVVAPGPIDEQSLVERFDSLRRQHADRRERLAGEAVGPDDEVLLDVLGFADGRLIPYSARENWRAEVAPDALLPGFFEALVGAKVGQSFGIELKLPDTYVVESLRGVTARFLLDVKAASELKLLEDDSPELLKRLGLGTLTDVMAHLGDTLARERTEEMDRLTQERVLDEVVSRTKVTLTPALVDEEIRRRWAETERPMLIRKDFQPNELQEALEGWLREPLTRADTERRLTLALALRAIAARDHVKLAKGAVDALVADLAGLSGVSRQDLIRAMKEDTLLAKRVEDLALHFATIDSVMRRVSLTPPT
ncbi:peptidylprolyl isomerase [Myxococcus llanfairpwllgwyngyllgogerychwyrndrobwllllantysiliogogogochensis]|uniref:Peptidylprolyl isomerase n=1 Tax=Myxococcus llanfairpwllgwyngyllgogerychwyrndrobwllllantysiliogogogochensis TaxID=2590453 RepID=A0A540WPJ3_9BACT|nr:peptidylprolyl isomerase [Myxococcus llanfairpwllgwyngyllgogerychwyrndrobwllllantysiliogogogochensis]TQF10787.1 peptidylprolyl isomerase [Myxococcus llanfairpwllgwyngyllgogerychwyrndrobwllllantysiliogogogochensis]